MVAHVEYSVAGHVETRRASFLIEPQNQGRRFVSGLASKPLGRFSPVWPQNRWRRFLAVGLKICCDGFLQFGLKTGGDCFSRVGLKTKAVEGFPVWASKPTALVW
jgi:hypothetical protein